MMITIFEEMVRLLDNQEAFVLVTVIGGSGSTPRGAGAHMIIRMDGTTSGTIGGGAIEYQSQILGREALEEKKSYVKTFTLAGNQAADLGMICGGSMVVYFQYISPFHQAFKSVCSQALDAFQRDEENWLMIDITDENAWTAELTKTLMPSKAGQITLEGRRYYVEPLACTSKVYIFGGGHVAQELVPVLSHVGFRCVVFDDREEFANHNLFPQADQTIVGDFDKITENVTIKKSDYICIMTRGHQYDYLVQKQALHTPAQYIGVMGSQKKLSILADKLKKEGYQAKDIMRFQAPIGLAILAETPSEIAVSIAGELIRTRAEARNLGL